MGFCCTELPGVASAILDKEKTKKTNITNKTKKQIELRKKIMQRMFFHFLQKKQGKKNNSTNKDGKGKNTYNERKRINESEESKKKKTLTNEK